MQPAWVEVNGLMRERALLSLMLNMIVPLVCLTWTGNNPPLRGHFIRFFRRSGIHLRSMESGYPPAV
jgi:hypothetical protein